MPDAVAHELLRQRVDVREEVAVRQDTDAVVERRLLGEPLRRGDQDVHQRPFGRSEWSAAQRVDQHLGHGAQLSPTVTGPSASLDVVVSDTCNGLPELGPSVPIERRDRTPPPPGPEPMVAG